jgi:hypothetical protein
VTRPEEFSMPIKVGFRGYGHITQDNLKDFHLPERCPLSVEVINDSKEI